MRTKGRAGREGKDLCNHADLKDPTVSAMFLSGHGQSQIECLPSGSSKDDTQEFIFSLRLRSESDGQSWLPAATVHGFCSNTRR